MSRGHSNTVLVADLLYSDGPFTHIADQFVASRCAGCDIDLQHDARHGEWGSFCQRCWPTLQSA